MANFQNGELKVWWRHWSAVLILSIIAGFVIWAMVNLGDWIKDWQNKDKLYNAEQYDSDDSTDNYGGKTKEETAGMFIDALEHSDINLASKYFVASKQNQWKRTLEEYKDSLVLNQLVMELKKNRLKEAVFQKNNFTNIWKIKTL